MKRVFFMLLTIVFIMMSAEAYGTNMTVYVNTDEYYHIYSCELKGDASPLPVEEAYWRYLPCSECNPPILTWDPVSEEYVVTLIYRPEGMYYKQIFQAPPTPDGEDPEYFDKVRIQALRDGSWARLHSDYETMEIVNTGEVQKDESSIWPYIILAVGCVLIVIGIFLIKSVLKFRANMNVIYQLEALKHGETCKLSIAQIVNTLVNLPDAHKNLSKAEFKRVYRLYKLYQKEKTLEEYDADRYIKQSSRIIVAFNNLAPFVKYSGEPDEEIAKAKLEMAYACLVNEDVEEDDAEKN